MTNQPLIYGICVIVLVAALFAAGCISIFPGGATATPAPVPTPAQIAVPSDTPIPSTCGFTTCHGSDLACGTNVPQICTAMYQIGDKCRQYARCDSSGGSCTLVVSSPKYTTCKACADNCQIQAGADGLAAMSCEEKC